MVNKKGSPKFITFIQTVSKTKLFSGFQTARQTWLVLVPDPGVKWNHSPHRNIGQPGIYSITGRTNTRLENSLTYPTGWNYSKWILSSFFLLTSLHYHVAMLIVHCIGRSKEWFKAGMKTYITKNFFNEYKTEVW